MLKTITSLTGAACPAGQLSVAALLLAAMIASRSSQSPAVLSSSIVLTVMVVAPALATAMDQAPAVAIAPLRNARLRPARVMPLLPERHPAALKGEPITRAGVALAPLGHGAEGGLLLAVAAELQLAVHVAQVAGDGALEHHVDPETLDRLDRLLGLERAVAVHRNVLAQATRHASALAASQLLPCDTDDLALGRVEGEPHRPLAVGGRVEDLRRHRRASSNRQHGGD